MPRRSPALSTRIRPRLAVVMRSRTTASGHRTGHLAHNDPAANWLQSPKVKKCHQPPWLVVVGPHTPALEAICGIPVEMLTAVPGLATTLSTAIPADSVVVAPDLGAVKLAEHYASLLHSTVAVVRKTRHSGTSVHAEELVGEVRDRPAVIVDDMISTGGTIEAAAHLLRHHAASSEVTVAATHGPLTAAAHDRLSALSLRSVVVTDSISHNLAPSPDLRVHSIAGLLADAIEGSRRPGFPRLAAG